MAAKEIERKQRAAEEEKNRLEMIEFEKKFGKKKYRERKRNVVEENEGYNWQILAAGLSALVMCLGIGIYLLL